jgi:hypothetical protein
MPPEWLALVSAILTGVPSLPQAACRGMAPGFDGTRDVDPIMPVTICRRCPELAPCREWFAGLPVDAQPVGVIGGEVRRDAHGRVGRVGGRRKHSAA